MGLLEANIQSWYERMSILHQAIQDHNGRISHARILALLVGFSATIFMWKLTITNKLTPDYFLYYLGYGVIHLNLSKSLDVLLAWKGGKSNASDQP